MYISLLTRCEFFFYSGDGEINVLIRTAYSEAHVVFTFRASTPIEIVAGDDSNPNMNQHVHSRLHIIHLSQLLYRAVVNEKVVRALRFDNSKACRCQCLRCSLDSISIARVQLSEKVVGETKVSISGDLHWVRSHANQLIVNSTV